MSNDPQSARQHKPERDDKFIPPPMDPYATYQTPYERRPHPEPNPFIEFRRFADKQISDMVAAFPALGNLSNMFGVEDGMKNFRDQLEKDMKDMLAHQKQMEEYFKTTREGLQQADRTSVPHAEPEPSKDQLRQLRSNSKDASTQNPMYGSGQVTALDNKSFGIDRATGQAIEPVSIAPNNEQQERSDRRARWRRGFRNCPELKKYQGETELDVYESLEEQQEQTSAKSSKPKEFSPLWSSSWLSGYGHDGKQRSQKVTKTDSHKGCGSFEHPSEITTYFDHQVKSMDPFKHDRDLLPWLFLSQYSPLFLSKADLDPVGEVDLHNGCVNHNCSKPMQMIGFVHRERPTSDQAEGLRVSMADHLPWADAFEDLMSLEKTGGMPPRKIGDQYGPQELQPTWVKGMVGRGLFGPNWWLENGGVMRNVSNVHRPSSSPIDTERNPSLDHNAEDRTDVDAADMSRDFMDKVAEAYLEAIPSVESVKEHYEAVLKELESSRDETQSKEESHLQQPTKNQTPEPHTAIPSKPQVEQQPQPQPQPPKPSIISTLTTMSTRTLSDGSVETKRVLKKRFADGNEESEESTELVYPQQPKLDAKKEAQQQQQNNKRPGWFWT